MSSEAWDAPSLVAFAEGAEEVGFSFAGISDHFHPFPRGHRSSAERIVYVVGFSPVLTRMLALAGDPR